MGFLNVFKPLVTSRERREVLLALTAAYMLVQLSSLPVAISLPTIAEYFDTGLDDAAWIIIVYLLALGSFVMLGARMGDRYGHERVFFVGLIASTLGSVLITFSNAFGGAGGGVAHFAHLGGFAAGFLYLKTDWRASQAIQSIGKAARTRRFAIVPREEREAATSDRRRSDHAGEKNTLDAVDRVLDKISAEGMASLTDQEKKLLDEVSKKHRTN